MHFINKSNNTYISTELSLPQKDSQSTEIDVDATTNSMPGILFIFY